MLQIVQELSACNDILRTRANTLVHNKADRDALLEHDLAFPSLRHLMRDAHRHNHRRRTEVIDMVIDRVGADAREVCDRHRAVERARVDDALRQKTELVHRFEHTHAEAAQSRDLQEDPDQIVGRIRIALAAVFRDVFLQCLMHLVDRELRFEVHLVHRALGFAGLQDHHADRDLIARIDRFVHDEAVDDRILGNRPDIRRKHQPEVGVILALRALFVEVCLHRFDRDVDLHHVHGITALIHDMRRDLIHRLRGLDASSVFSHACSPSFELAGFCMVSGSPFRANFCTP